MLRAISSSILYSDRRFYSAFPSVASLPGGDSVLVFRRARDHRWLRAPRDGAGQLDLDSVDHLDPRSHLALLRLTDAGLPTGAPEMLPPDPEAADQDASLLALRDGRLVLAGFAWYPVAARFVADLRAMGAGVAGSPETTGSHFLFWGGYTRLSDDGGRTWSERAWLPVVPEQPDLVPGRRPYLGGPVRGRPIERSDGTLLLAGYALRRNGKGAALLHRSSDRGRTWSFAGTIAEDPDGVVGFLEPALQSLPDGRIVAFCRTAGLGDRLATAESADDGRSWSPWRPHAVVGHPFDACPLPDGRILLVYGYRHPPFGVRARVYDPLRQAPEDVPEAILRDDAVSPDVGYPWATVLRDGRVLVAHYAADGRGIRHIAGILAELT